MVMSQNQQNTLRAYNAIGPLYAEYSQKYRAYLGSVDQLVVERLADDMKLLDLGSGDGRRLKAISDHRAFSRIVAVEPSQTMAEICRRTTGFEVHELCGNMLNQLAEAEFDVITSLWNVFGHMDNSQDRLTTLGFMAAKLKTGGRILLDVNNRHNRMAYGQWNVRKRRILDALFFDEKRGDAVFDWKIGDQSFPTSGHLFTPGEIETLFRKAGLIIAERYSVNYATGEVSTSPFDGQLFYVLEKI